MHDPVLAFYTLQFLNKEYISEYDNTEIFSTNSALYLKSDYIKYINEIKNYFKGRIIGDATILDMSRTGTCRITSYKLMNNKQDTVVALKNIGRYT